MERETILSLHLMSDGRSRWGVLKGRGNETHSISLPTLVTQQNYAMILLLESAAMFRTIKECLASHLPRRQMKD